MSRRSERVGDLLRQEISNVILRDLQDPRVRLATVSSIDVSPDLRQATVLVSVLGEETDRNECLEALGHARGFIRSRLARELRHMRVVPELSFELDRGPEYSHQIDQILEHLDDTD